MIPKIPDFLFREPVEIESYLGNSAYGPQYGLPVADRCHIEPGRKVVTNPKGQEVVSEATAFFRPATVIAAEDRITWAGRTYVVIDARPQRAMGVHNHTEVYLK